MRCPGCGSHRLRVAVAFKGMVACAFRTSDDFELLNDVELDSRWDDAAQCECLKCAWTGEVGDAVRAVASGRSRSASSSTRESLASRSTPLSAADLQRISGRLDVGFYDPAWADDIRRLVAEVDRLNSLLDLVSRVSKTSGQSRRGNDDTVVA